MTFMFCSAEPACPFIRLSMCETTIIRPVRGSETRSVGPFAANAGAGLRDPTHSLMTGNNR